MWAKEVKPENEATCILTRIFCVLPVCTMWICLLHLYASLLTSHIMASREKPFERYLSLYAQFFWFRAFFIPKLSL